MSGPLWQPSVDRMAHTHLTRFTQQLSERTRQSFPTYAALHQWSVTSSEGFWPALWEFFDILGDRGGTAVRDARLMPGAEFFPDARLSFVENLLRRRGSSPAIMATTEDGRERSLSWDDLHVQVRRAAVGLQSLGVRPGDRVAAMVANVPEAIVAALGSAAIGAVWSSCSPDFGVQGVIDRFGQIEPVVLFGVDGYQYGGKYFDCLGKLDEVVQRLPTVRHTIVIPYGDRTVDPGRCSFHDWLNDNEAPAAAKPSESTPAAGAGVGPRGNESMSRGMAASGGGAPLATSFDDTFRWERFPFNHPLYILYSSGTTGVPKCIVHGAGGTLIQHLKEHRLHTDLHADDRFFYFTTCGWMMWNWLVSGLASGATLVLYDGSPMYPDARRLFDLADGRAITVFGVSAKFLDGLQKSGLKPRETHRLDSLRTIMSTGSPLSVEGFEFVHRDVKPDVHLASISGGTDIVGLFAGGNPNAPVWAGEIQAPCLGMDLDVFDEAGRSAGSSAGELVCKSPFPSMPVGFWNDPDGAKYHAAYFEVFPNVWRHGDWVRRTAHGGLIIYGRSDATLNPGGVRIGTAEIYRQVEQVPEVLESIAVGQQWQDDERIVLFVRLREGLQLDDDLRRTISSRIRGNTSPRHVPARIIQVSDIPRTKSGKIVELAVRHVIHHREVRNVEALANPEALELYRDRPELQT